MALLQEQTDKTLTASVIIPTFNRPGLALSLAKKIRSFHSDIDLEIIIVDQQQTANISKANKDMYQLFVETTTKAHTSHAKNKGIQRARGNIVIFFDDDVEITSHTIPAHLATYTDQHIIGVAGRVINDDDSIPQNTEVETGHMNRYATTFTMQFWSTKQQLVDFPYGCNMSFRKEILTKIGGFDEHFPPPLSAFEEVDLGLRAQAYGTILFEPATLVYHHKAQQGGTRVTPPERMKLFYYSYGYYVRKHVEFPHGIVTLLKKTLTLLKEAPYAIGSFYTGFTHSQ